MKKILITGTAGFIGFHLTKKLITEEFDILGLDIINDYYDLKLKYDRLKFLGIDKKNIEKNKILSSKTHQNLRFIQADLANHDFIVDIMKVESFDYVINLAAQAGVRYSISNPRAYTYSNIDGFLSILEGARYSKVKHLIYASTSSVYGLNTEMPLKEIDSAAHPMALYAATKKANELMAHSYSHLFDLPTSGLRFFTVYGPWGRPDMALFLFAEAIMKGEKINIFNHGNMIRDFTYVDDIVTSLLKLIPLPPTRESISQQTKLNPNKSSAPYRIFNIGNGSPVELMEYIKAIENSLNKKGQYNMMDMQPGDVPATHADTRELEKYIGFKPKTSIEYGVNQFINWYKKYYQIK